MILKFKKKRISIIKLNYRLLYYSFFEFFKIFFCFYLKNPWLFFLDIVINIRFLWLNPYRSLTQFSKKRILNFNYLYGETPYSVWNAICKEIGISSQDILYDLGCGLGKLCFWSYFFVKCKKIVGIEQSKSYVTFLNKIKKYFFFKENLVFLNQDFLQSNLTDGTVIYVYGSAFSLSMIRKVIIKLSETSVGTVIITVSYSLTEFELGRDFFSLTSKIRCSFSWGSTFVYIHRRK